VVAHVKMLLLILIQGVIMAMTILKLMVKAIIIRVLVFFYFVDMYIDDFD